MANLLPTDLTLTATIPAEVDIFLLQKDGESEVKQISYTDLMLGALRTGGAEDIKLARINDTEVLIDGVNVAVDLSLADSFTLTATQDFELDFPTNMVAGDKGFITITQDATGSRLMAHASGYVTDSTGVTLTTTPDAIDVIQYFVISNSMILLTKIADIV